jgi:23S rRNA (pseudouridine1915-N3)-methyltransferase
VSQVLILAVGHKPPAWVSAACADYLGRFGRRLKVELKEIAPARRGAGGGAGTATALSQEDARLLSALPEGAFPVLLEPRGQMLDSPGLAAALSGWLSAGSPLAFLIGGADGFGPRVLARAPIRWSLSALTLPHMLARVVVLEQLYRAFSLLHNLPYHRDH